MARKGSKSPVFAIVADVHGNRWALEAVLADARQHGATHLLNLGDVLYGPLDPAGTADVLLGLDWPTVAIRGNQDRILFEPTAEEHLHRSLAFTRSHATPDAIAWLSGLPTTARHEDVLLVHGTPSSDETYLLEDASPEGVRPRSPSEVAELLGPETSATLVLCGHSHLPGAIQLPEGPLVLNPGSVGLPAYSEEQPVVHRMEVGSPAARYALAEKAAGGWRVAWVAVPYDYDSAAAAAERTERPDWAHALRTGRVA